MNSIRFEQSIPVRYHELDHHGRLKPVMLLNYLQDCAGIHAGQLGVSVTDLRKNGLTWVLSRVHLSVERYPRADESITIVTWPSTRHGLFSCREFLIHDQKRVCIASATTSWAVLDRNSRRPVRLEGNLPPYPLDATRAIADDFATLPSFPAAASQEATFRVLRSDLDSNQHVNNTVFVGWALESVPEEVAGGMLCELEITFRAEALYGETISSRCAVGENGICLHQIVNRTDGRELARLRTKWNPPDATLAAERDKTRERCQK